MAKGGDDGATCPQVANKSTGASSSSSSSKKRSRVSCKNVRREIGHIDNYLFVSTKLCLHDQSWPPNETPCERRLPSQEDERIKTLTKRIGQMKYYSPKEDEKERRIGVSTKLELFTYPWKITKKLVPSDLNHLSRLLVPSKLVDNYILPLLDDGGRNEVGTDRGMEVTVWDFDTNSSHRVVFKKWTTSNSYVFNGNWSKDFVRRRRLDADDEIGMYWDSFYSRFHFCVLTRAAAAADHHHQQGP